MAISLRVQVVYGVAYTCILKEFQKTTIQCKSRILYIHLCCERMSGYICLFSSLIVAYMIEGITRVCLACVYAGSVCNSLALSLSITSDRPSVDIGICQRGVLRHLSEERPKAYVRGAS